MSQSNVLAIVAIVLSGVSLGWQALAWKRTGPVVALTASKVRGRQAIMVTAVNSGRSPVSVMKFKIRLLADYYTVQDPKFAPDSEQLPLRLEPGASATWKIDVTEVEEMIRKFQRRRDYPSRRSVEQAAAGDPAIVCAALGNGKTVEARPVYLLTYGPPGLPSRPEW